MADPAAATGAIGEPSPHRHRVRDAAVAAGVLGAPLAWSLHLMFNLAIAINACTAGGPHDRSAQAFILASSALALAIAAICGWLSWRTWKLTHTEDRGEHEHLLEIGEGRTRFLGLVGMIASGGFFAATIFDTLALFVVPICR